MITSLRERDVDDQPRAPSAAPSAAPPAKGAPTEAPPEAPTRNPDGTPTERGWLKIGQLFRADLATKQRKGKGNQQFDYITARQVADRLDSVVGPGNWETHFLVIDTEKAVVQCTLVIFGQHKSDVGYPNNPTRPELEDEPFKAAYSDAFKRAAVQWGIGRFLYDDN